MAAPTWSETALTTVVSSGISSSLSRNAVTETTFNASAKFACRFLLNVSRTDAVALTNGVDVVIRPKTAIANAGTQVHGESFHALSQFAAAQTTTISGSNVAAGATTLNVASTTGMAAGDLAIVGAGTAREEWVRVARVTSSTALLIDAPTVYAHTTAQADAVTNKSDTWVVELDGGCTYEIIFDYGDDAAGSAVRIWGVVQTLDTIA